MNSKGKSHYLIYDSFLQAEEGEKTLQFRQKDLKPLLQIQNAQKIFNLNLPQSRYCQDFSLNGNTLALGSSKGHLTLLNWKTKDLQCEINIKEPILDIKFLQNENFIATAQKKHVYIYDRNGIELHKLSNHVDPLYLEYLKYHFLLVSAGKQGVLKYHDVSTGKIVSEYRTKVREPSCFKQNPSNGIMCMGDSRGVVTMYSPNTPQPLVQMLTQKSNVSALGVSHSGNYLVTSGNEGIWKIWDLRTYKMLYDYWSPKQIKNVDISQRGILALGMGNQCQFWKDWTFEKQKFPYMKHEQFSHNQITDFGFIPYEDFFGISSLGGYESIVVPGSGEANFDTYEANPMATKKQESEDLVQKLLQKNIIGTIDEVSKEVLLKEQQLEEKEKESQKIKKNRKKMRGRNKIGRREHAKELQRDLKQIIKAKDHVNMTIRAKQAEKARKKKELGELQEMDGIDFEPYDLLRKQRKLN